VIHRDLKPANVKVRPDGTVKVLDFGLAKALEPVGAFSGLSMSPTVATPGMTAAGIIVGTAAYMSPEQARGKPVDRRADIWAFGCVLFEMLARQRPFPDGDTVSDTLAAILRDEPAWQALPADTPPHLRALLERCLRRDPRRRLSHIAEARIAIEDHGRGEPISGTSSPRVHNRHRWLWPAVAAVSSVAALALAAVIAWRQPPALLPTRFDISPPPGAIPMATALGRTMEVGEPLSPDGRAVVFIAAYQGRPLIWFRSLDSPFPKPLPNTEEAARPVWSADGQSIAFLAEGRLKRIAATGGAPTTLATVGGRDLAWGSQNVILIGGQQGEPLRRVSADGGPLQAVTTLAPGDISHDYPQFLPDGRRFLYMARRGANPEDWSVYAGSLDSAERELIPGIHAGVRYSPTGHLLFVQGDDLMAQRFDAGRLTVDGRPFRVSSDISPGPRTPLSIASNGTLSYLTEAPVADSQLTWVSRDGRAIGTVGPVGRYGRIRLSRDGRLVAFDTNDDVLTLDIDRGLVSKTVSLAGADFAPVFSPDGNTIAFASSREPATNAGATNTSAGHLYTKAVAGVGDGAILFRSNRGKQPMDWSRDGRYLAYTSGNDIWALALPLAPNAEPIQITNTPFAESSAVFSPDGRWIAYQSTDSAAGRDVYVQSFPDGGRRYAVSVGGGSTPRWSNSGAELFYVSPDLQMMSVSFTHSDSRPTIGRPVPLFASRAFQREPDYDVAADGRFLLNIPSRDQQGMTVAVIVNWAATLNP
jgi:Tol biopolymer transport system component